MIGLGPQRRRTALFVGLALAAIVGAVAGVLLLLPPVSIPDSAGGVRPDSATAISPKSLARLSFEDASGRRLTLADFRGRTVLLNVWATWCAPCRKEMPTLDRLQAKLGGPAFAVLALSIDRNGLKDVEPFFAEVGIRTLHIYLDRSSSAMRVLHITGIPTTLLIDREGREIRRWIGPAEWDSPEHVALIQAQIASGKAADARPRPSLRQQPIE